MPNSRCNLNEEENCLFVFVAGVVVVLLVVDYSMAKRRKASMDKSKETRLFGQINEQIFSRDVSPINIEMRGQTNRFAQQMFCPKSTDEKKRSVAFSRNILH